MKIGRGEHVRQRNKPLQSLQWGGGGHDQGASLNEGQVTGIKKVGGRGGSHSG